MSEKQLWGGETSKAVENFPVSGERVPASVVHWLGRIKGAAARTNAELGLLDGEVAERIAAAADEVADGAHDDQFPRKFAAVPAAPADIEAKQTLREQ